MNTFQKMNQRIKEPYLRAKRKRKANELFKHILIEIGTRDINAGLKVVIYDFHDKFVAIKIVVEGNYDFEVFNTRYGWINNTPEKVKSKIKKMIGQYFNKSNLSLDIDRDQTNVIYKNG